MKNNFKILTSLWFLIGLVLLLLNDFIFKEIYGNWLTGKLSDFAGLFIFPLFWTAIFPKNKNKIFLLTAVFFIFWKSPYSEFLLDSWNRFVFFEIARVVDYSDLMALVVLPLAFIYENKYESNKMVKLNPVIPFVLTVFSFMATSYYSDIAVAKEYLFDFPKDTLEKRVFDLTVRNMFYRGYNTVDPSKIHPYNKETYIKEEGLTEDEIIQDTMVLFINEEFCFDGYKASIVLSGDSISSKLELIGFHHRCPKDDKNNSTLKGKNDLEKLTNSFETKIIQALKQK